MEAEANTDLMTASTGDVQPASRLASLFANPEQYQESLRQRLEQARLKPIGPRLLGLHSPEHNWLVSASAVGDILPVPPLQPVPLARPWLRGIALAGGRLWSVVDVGALLGAAPLPLTRDARIVLAPHAPAGNLALLFAEVRGLVEMGQFTPLGEELQVSWIRQSYRDEQGSPWHFLNLPALAGSAALANPLELAA